MHIYWRIIEELKELGETVVFNEPSLLREFQKWCRKNKVNMNKEKRGGYFCPLYN